MNLSDCVLDLVVFLLVMDAVWCYSLVSYASSFGGAAMRGKSLLFVSWSLGGKGRDDGAGCVDILQKGLLPWHLMFLVC